MKTIVTALVCGLIGFGHCAAQETATNSDGDQDVWAPFRPLIGKWVGERTGMGGDATQSVEWKFVLGDQFIQCTTKTLTGDDPHADLGMISYDQVRRKLVYRSFFSEGFVTQYVATIADDGTISFETEAIENGPPGLRVREVLQLKNGVLKQECLMANGDGPFQSCIMVTLKRDE